MSTSASSSHFKPFLLIALGVLVLILSGAWYRGFIPCFSGEERACLRDSLNLGALPSSLTIIASGIDDSSNRRYAFDAEVSISPSSAEKLLSGRSFNNERWTREMRTIGCSRTIYPYRGFPATECHSWHRTREPADGDLSDLTCTVYFNSAHDRALVQFVAE